MKYNILIVLFAYFSMTVMSCGESMDSDQEEFTVQDLVSWELNGDNYSKSGKWTYCDAEDFSGNFAIYGTNTIEGEGVIISIDDTNDPVSKGKSYSFDSNSIGQLIYVDDTKNRWTSQIDEGNGKVEIVVYSDTNGLAVEGRFSGTLISVDDGSIRVIENGFFSVRCL